MHLVVNRKYALYLESFYFLDSAHYHSGTFRTRGLLNVVDSSRKMPVAPDSGGKILELTECKSRMVKVDDGQRKIHGRSQHSLKGPEGF